MSAPGSATGDLSDLSDSSDLSDRSDLSDSSDRSDKSVAAAAHPKVQGNFPPGRTVHLGKPMAVPCRSLPLSSIVCLSASAKEKS